MKEILLTQEKTALVDDKNYDYLNQWKWFAVKNGNTYYAARKSITKNGKRHTIWMHRVILKPLRKEEIDHINHNGLDNQEHNIRKCNRTQNNINTRPRGRSKYMGVSYVNNKYIQASIKINGKSKYLGCFNTEEEAAKQYDKYARKYHGEFANLNFK